MVKAKSPIRAATKRKAHLAYDQKRSPTNNRMVTYTERLLKALASIPFRPSKPFSTPEPKRPELSPASTLLLLIPPPTNAVLLA